MKKLGVASDLKLLKKQTLLTFVEQLFGFLWLSFCPYNKVTSFHLSLAQSESDRVIIMNFLSLQNIVLFQE